MATAVISANEAIHYADHLWHGIPVIPVTIGLLALFMILIDHRDYRIGRRSRSAFFSFISSTLSTLLCVGGVYVFQNGTGQLIENYQQPLTAPNSTDSLIPRLLRGHAGDLGV